MDAARVAFDIAKGNLGKAMADGAAAKVGAEEAKKKLDEAMKAGREV